MTGDILPLLKLNLKLIVLLQVFDESERERIRPISFVLGGVEIYLFREWNLKR